MFKLTYTGQCTYPSVELFLTTKNSSILNLINTDTITNVLLSRDIGVWRIGGWENNAILYIKFQRI